MDKIKQNGGMLLMFVLTVLLLAAYVLLVFLKLDASFIQVMLFGSFSATAALATGSKQASTNVDIDKAAIDVTNRP